MNQFSVGANGKKVSINNIAPQPRLTPKEALELAAWLTATALPLQPGDVSEQIGKFIKRIAEIAAESGEDDLSALLEKELEE